MGHNLHAELKRFGTRLEWESARLAEYMLVIQIYGLFMRWKLHWETSCPISVLMTTSNDSFDENIKKNNVSDSDLCKMMM